MPSEVASTACFASSLGDHDPRYRRNVGMVVFNSHGRVWLGRRQGYGDVHSWQFPQGGVDANEGLEAAARRELREETGISSARVLDRLTTWVTYDFPPEALSRGRGFVGQAQAWFAFRFEGADTEVDLAADTSPEFDAWRWATLSEAVEGVVSFKRTAYEQVARTFGRYAVAPPPQD